MKALRLTRHEASEKQLNVLNSLFELETVDTISETLPSNSREAVARFDELANGYDIVEAVLPINLLEAILKFSEFSKRDGVLLRAVTNRNLNEDGSVTFEFDHYEKVVKVEIVTEDLYLPPEGYKIAKIVGTDVSQFKQSQYLPEGNFVVVPNNFPDEVVVWVEKIGVFVMPSWEEFNPRFEIGLYYRGRTKQEAIDSFVRS